MKSTVIGVDLAKRSMQVCILGEDHQIQSNTKVPRNQFFEYITMAPEEVPIAMEACATSHHWARRFKSLGREVILLPPQHVKPLVGHQKNDANDAVAICEAASRPRIHRVSVKSVEQQDIQSLRRIRQRHVNQRTALSNQIRGLCAEYGLCFRQSLRHLCIDLQASLADSHNELSTIIRAELHELYSELQMLDTRVSRLDRQIHSLLRRDSRYALLRDIPGIGPLSASALISEVGDGKHFSCGREVSAWAGLVPKQYSSGTTQRLMGITKNGDRELRTLLIHGARAVVYRVKNKDNPMGRWLKALIARRGIHKAIVALANKLGRIAWAVLRYQQAFDMNRAFA